MGRQRSKGFAVGRHQHRTNRIRCKPEINFPIGSGGRDCARPPSHTTGHAVFSHPAVGAGGLQRIESTRPAGVPAVRHSALSFAALPPNAPRLPQSARPPESTGGFPVRDRSFEAFRATSGAAPESGCQPVSSRLRPFAPAAFTAFLATMASADFCPPLSGQISPGKVHGLSGRAAGLYLMRLSVTVGFRGSQHTHRSHPASLSVPVRTVVPLIHPSSSAAVARQRLGLHYDCCHSTRQPPFRLLVHAHAGRTRGRACPARSEPARPNQRHLFSTREKLRIRCVNRLRTVD